MKVRAKFSVTKVAEFGDYNGNRQEILRVNGDKYESTGIPIREITLSVVYDNGVDAENASFAEATPNGSMTFTLNNPDCADEFKVGDNYYIDFSRIEKAR
jgi:hypothetical protein